MILSFPSCTCAKMAPKPKVEASVYNWKGKLNSGYAVMGAVISKCLSLVKAL